jgi:ElaB/YqjD/DUF883 family membrane-anchored ribosome-binding protein
VALFLVDADIEGGHRPTEEQVVNHEAQ